MKINNITENRFLRVVNEKFGTDLSSRFEKLSEEMEELFEAFGYQCHFEYSKSEITDNRYDLDHLKDELCDVYGILTHIAGLLGMNQREMLDTVLDKLKQRETDPEYKKQKQSVN
jgi:NTP pyrophosphatase (non-canonical NTP hydrolase)